MKIRYSGLKKNARARKVDGQLCNPSPYDSVKLKAAVK